VPAFAEAPLCFDASGSAVAYTCPADSGNIPIKGSTSNRKFEQDACYVLYDSVTGWEKIDKAKCNEDRRFDNAIKSVSPIPTTKSGVGKDDCPAYLANDEGGCDIIKRYLNPTINLISAIFGLVITISIVIGAIQMGSSRDNPQAFAAGKKRVVGSLITFGCFLVAYWFLQWVVPGGFL
jgi:hypothetical protein